ncbi:extracellular solute-binding protein [Demequina sp. SYSU T00039]|uniref:Extracellular solute-binding protein n=1 Tax=Demequina lignilytica TaxID=3051663 RepID=A0AAW7M2D1_9MICO|nr:MULTISPECIES: extracellular solute-binding protein [unclassified Demequina]MDN4477860.1 extracellular solute-binding protein [Demequina sp. SYSU T00039-1]MDN4487769.1 extracellular solute-binding protein [Demequina sp. SYSU T00039]MDN4490848.1 extracellular solute-binding protein [Demequina sp. SYSU T00068]
MGQRSFRWRRTGAGAMLAGMGAVALTLSACSSSDGGDGGSSGEPGQPAGDQNLTIMFWGDERAPEQWKTLGDAFIADGHENVKIEYIHQPAEYDTKIQTLVAANQTPDVFFMNSAGMGRFIDAGTLLDLAPVYDELGIDLDSEYLEPAIWREDESVWGLSPLIHLMVMFYDKAAFDAAGIDTPPTDPAEAWSWDDFVAAATALSDPSSEGDGWGSMILTDPLVTAPLLASNGAYWFDEEAMEFTLNDPSAVEVYENIKALADTGVSIPPANLSSMGLDVVLQSRQAPLYPGGTWNLQAVTEAWGEDAGMALYPSYGDPKSMAVTDQLVVSAKTQNPELAAEFVHFATQAENNPAAYDGVPATRAATEGNGRETWLTTGNRPLGFEETIDNSLDIVMDDPSRKVRDLINVWNTVQWTDDGINGYFTDLVPDLGAALDGFKPTVDQMLQAQ